MNSTDKLNEYLEQCGEDAAEQCHTPFNIENTEQAMWAMRKLASIEKERSEAIAAANAEIERIKTWLAAEEKKADDKRRFFDGLLEGYHRRVLTENPKKKTIKLPHGELQFRTQKPEFEKDEKVLLDWAKVNKPQYVTEPPPTESKLEWAELKKIINVMDGKAVDPSSGEVIPGITVIERDSKFNIKLVM